MTGWELVVAGPARRPIERIPAKVGAAILDLLIGPLRENPHRVGMPLRGDLAGLHSARVGAHRVVYEIKQEDAPIHVLCIDHRAEPGAIFCRLMRYPERMTKRLIDVDDDKLDAVRTLLGTATLKATVDGAFDEVLALDERRRTLLAQRGVDPDELAGSEARRAAWG